MSFSSSYLPLDGVEFKISDAINPPPLPSLPQNFKMNDVSKLLSESVFDFTLETSVLAKISSVREAEKKMAEKEEQRKVLSLKRRAEAEKRRLEEMMTQQREVLQKKREEFLEQKRKKQQEKEKDNNSPESASPTMDTSNTSRVSPTYENVVPPPKIPSRNPFPTVQDGILTPQPVVRKTADSSTKLNQSQPVLSGQNQIWEDFEDKELDPFTNVELKTIDDLAELQTVLQNARIGQGINVATPAPIAEQDRSQDQITNKVNSQTPSPSNDSSTEETQVSTSLCENISLQEVNEIAEKLEKQSNDSSKETLKNREKSPQFLSDATKKISTNDEIPLPTSSNNPEPLYSKVHKNLPDHSSNNQPQPVQTTFNPNNPFLSTLDFGAIVNGSQLPPNLQNSTHSPIGYSPVIAEIGIDQSALYANLFNPVSISPLSSNMVCSNSSSGSSSPVFPRAVMSQTGVAKPTSNHVNSSVNSKILPVSFGPVSSAVTNPTMPAASNTILNRVSVSQPKNTSQHTWVTSKPPVPAPRKPAIPPRKPTKLSSTIPNKSQVPNAVQNGIVTGQAHLTPPYAIATNTSDANTLAPSTESGFIHKSKPDRVKFAETVNKALSSLPQNPAPAPKKTPAKANHETQPHTTVSRTLSLKSSLIAGLTSEEQTFAKNMMSMGFESEATIRAMQQFGLDDKEVIDHLIQVQNIMEQGFTSQMVQDALEMYPKDAKSVVVYLTKFQQLADMGFPEDKVRDALKTHDNDQAKAIDQLMEAT